MCLSFLHISCFKNQMYFSAIKLDAMCLHAVAVTRRCSVKQVLLEISQNSRENTCAKVCFLIKLQAEICNFIKTEILAQVFSCEFCKIFKNIFSYRTSPVTASAHGKQRHSKQKFHRFYRRL